MGKIFRYIAYSALSAAFLSASAYFISFTSKIKTYGEEADSLSAETSLQTQNNQDDSSKIFHPDEKKSNLEKILKKPN